jgi:hypothetical protein
MKFYLIFYFVLITTHLLAYSKDKYETDSLKIRTDSVAELVDFHGDFSLDVLSFYRAVNLKTEKGSINFNNQIAELDRSDFGLYFRPSYIGNWRKIKFDIQPRVNTEFNQIKNRYEINKFYLQKAKIDFQINENLVIRGGRFFKSIGTGMFTNPSNPFFIETTPLNPKLEIYPQDFIEFGIHLKNNFTLNAIANIDKGNDSYYEAPFFDFQKKYAVQLDYYGSSFQLGSILSIDQVKSGLLGIYGQKNIGRSIVVWVDASMRNKVQRFYPRAPLKQEVADLVNYEMIDGKENNKYTLQSVVGMSYTFSFGPTISAEYYLNKMGFNKTQLDDFAKMIYYSSDYNFDITKELSKRNMARSLYPGMRFIRDNYIFSQFGQNDVLGKFNYFVRYFNCLDDQSQQFSGMIELNISDKLELYSVLLFNKGEKPFGDFSRIIKNQIMAGLIYRL